MFPGSTFEESLAEDFQSLRVAASVRPEASNFGIQTWGCQAPCGAQAAIPLALRQHWVEHVVCGFGVRKGTVGGNICVAPALYVFCFVVLIFIS